MKQCVRSFLVSRSVVLVLILLIAASSSVFAQPLEPPWPNGCSVGAPAWVQQGIDGLFLGACDAHDRCWGQCNGQNPTFLDLGDKAQCDLRFLFDMEAACVAIAAVVALPLDGASSAEDFIED